MKLEYSDVISRSIYYSLGEQEIKPYTFVQIYTNSCLMYGYPFQTSGRVELADSYKNKDAPPQLLKVIDEMFKCVAYTKNYNFKCLPWYVGGKNINGMYFTYPSFNGDSEYCIGLCQYYKSSNPNEQQMERQLCNAIKINELNNLVKRLSTGLDYYYILDRQLQLVAMHSNMTFANISSDKITWEKAELNYLSLQEKNNFLESIPEQFYRGKSSSDFEEEYAGEKVKDKYHIGSFTKQGDPYMYVAYQIFVLDTSLKDVPFNYEERMNKKVKKYKSYYTVFNVINENTLFAQYYQLEQDIENIYFILLWIQIAASLIIIIYSISVTFELANSQAMSIDIIIYLLRVFAPQDHSDFSELKSMLAPFDEINYLFCSEINQIYEAFKSLMHIITFRNKTTSISSISDGQTLLDWVFACSFFENMMGNHTFLGISYNNLGNIHFNSHRYLEACQCYHMSIIHLNYLINELEQVEGVYTNISISSNQALLKKKDNNREDKKTSSILGELNFELNTQNQQTQQFSQARKTKATSMASILSRVKKRVSSIPIVQAMNEQTEVNYVSLAQQYQDLMHLKFERQYQYIRSQKMYFLSTKPQMHLWKEQITQLKDLFNLDSNLNPPQPSRTVMILLEMSFCYLMKNKQEKAQSLINLSLSLFLQNSNNNYMNNSTLNQLQRNAQTTNENQNINNESMIQKNLSVGNNVLMQMSRIRELSRISKRNQTIFSESQNAYLGLLQQNSSVLQNPYIISMVNELNNSKIFKKDDTKQQDRQTINQTYQMYKSSPGKQQNNIPHMNINDALEMMKLSRPLTPNNTRSFVQVQRIANQIQQSLIQMEKVPNKIRNGVDFNQQINENNQIFRGNVKFNTISSNKLKEIQDTSPTNILKNSFKKNYSNQQFSNYERTINNKDYEKINQSLDLQTPTEEVFIGEKINAPMINSQNINQLEKQCNFNELEKTISPGQQNNVYNPYHINLSQSYIPEQNDLPTPPVLHININSGNQLQNQSSFLMGQSKEKSMIQLQQSISFKEDNNKIFFEDELKLDHSPKRINPNFSPISFKIKKKTQDLENSIFQRQLTQQQTKRNSGILKINTSQFPQSSYPYSINDRRQHQNSSCKF